MESHSQIEDEVAEWLARRDAGSWSEDDEARLQQWIGENTARRVAYLRLKSTWDAAARLRALRAGALPGTTGGGVPPPDEWRRSPFFEQSPAQARGVLQHNRAVLAREPGTVQSDATCNRTPEPRIATEPSARRSRYRNLRLAIAASASFLIAGGGFAAYQFWGNGDRYSTPVGGLASVPMADGSNITLNTDSVIRVALTAKERRVQLEQGEAFFDVAKDSQRPFIVRAGDKRITAVGTKFSVQHLDEDVRVLVTEGKVRVEDETSAPVLIAAGDVARAAGSGVVVQRAPPPQLEAFLSWRAGYLRFHETVLADAVSEINRYNTRKIFVDDPRLAAIRISGTFRPTQYEAFVRVLQDGFAIEARTEGERITLSQGR
jgi:transmembrane sensor